MYLLKHGMSHAFKPKWRAEQKWKKDSQVSFQMRVRVKVSKNYLNFCSSKGLNVLGHCPSDGPLHFSLMQGFPSSLSLSVYPLQNK